MAGRDAWVVQCLDCPAKWNPDYGFDQPLEWTFPFTDQGKVDAQMTLDAHQKVQGHNPTLLQSHTTQFRLVEINHEVMSRLFDGYYPEED